MTTVLDEREAALERENAELRRQLEERSGELREAREQQTATAEVLQVINSSPGDLAPVFAAMVERAARLCEADEAALRTFDGELLHLGSVHGSKPEVVERLWQLGPTRLFGLYEAFARGETVVHFADVRETDIFRNDPVVRERLELRGIRSWLAVALQKDGIVLGVINVHRHTVRPFTGKQIALLQNFAAQAVIAMENARLLTETREALAQQTATAEVLQVINSSPGDLTPVFDAILEKAHALCEAVCGTFPALRRRALSARSRYAAEPRLCRVMGQHGAFARLPARFAGRYRVASGSLRSPTWPTRGAPIDDPLAQAAGRYRRYPHPTCRAIAQGRSAPRRHHLKSPRGAAVFRQADRAVAELRGTGGDRDGERAADHRDARGAWSSRPRPPRCCRSSIPRPATSRRCSTRCSTRRCSLCQAVLRPPCTLTMANISARRGARRARLCRMVGTAWRRSPTPGAGPLGRIAQGERVVVTDYLRGSERTAPIPQFKALVDAGGLRSAVAVALRKDDALLGSIHIYRQEVRPFSDKQIALLQNFAAQAVIAIENARLLTETREALEQQTATAEVLQVINSSPGDLAPVFDAMLERAMRLCDAALRYPSELDGDGFAAAGALRRVPERIRRILLRNPITHRPGTRTRSNDATGQSGFALADLAEYPPYLAGDPLDRAMVDLGGARTSSSCHCARISQRLERSRSTVRKCGRSPTSRSRCCRISRRRR